MQNRILKTNVIFLLDMMKVKSFAYETIIELFDQKI